MKCPICNEGETKQGKTTVTIDNENSIIFFKEVLALICENCGENYFSSKVSKILQKIAQESLKKGIELEIIKLPKVA